MRVKAAKLNNDKIKWRSHEPSRIETFSDAAFAFALTLIIVSIEVPKSFDDLMETMKGTVSFAVCFVALFKIWNNQNLFFRRYGVNDDFTITLNAVLLFVVLIYTYPLKFLSELLFLGSTYKLNGVDLPKIRDTQVKPLLLIYGAGFVVVYLLFFLMHRHVQKFAGELKLTAIELFETKTVTGINLICVFLCLGIMLVTYMAPEMYTGDTGFLYFAIPAAYFIWYSYRGKKGRQLHGE